jgi:hypothetical protein
MVVQLGHREPSCPCPGPVQKNFVVVDISGIHTIDIRFCACHDTIGGSSSHIQLLRFRCFPSTITRPRSAFTFEVLNTFHLLTLQSKVSAYDFYSSLAHKTDNTGILNIKVRFAPFFLIELTFFDQNRYRQFLTVVRQWRHLKALKRAGRGHDPTGVGGTQPGQCAVECPACPHPDRNIPDNWNTLPESQRCVRMQSITASTPNLVLRWLYSLNVAIDANFRLKNKARVVQNDPPLGDGWGHWVPEEPYQEYLHKHGHQTEVRVRQCAIPHCNNLAAQFVRIRPTCRRSCQYTLLTRLRSNGRRMRRMCSTRSRPKEWNGKFAEGRKVCYPT